MNVCRRLAWGIAAVALLVAPAIEAQPIQELASGPLGLPTFPGAILAYKDNVFVGAGTRQRFDRLRVGTRKAFLRPSPIPSLTVPTMTHPFSRARP